MSKNVYVFAEQRDGVIQKVAYELIGKARELADALGQEVVAVVLGDGIQAAAAELFKFGADQVIAWPTAEIAVMGPAGAANIIFRKDPDVEAKTAEYIDNFATPYQAAKRGMVDIVIQPKDSRPTIINALQMLDSKRESRPAKKHGNIPL